jgi:ribosomal protein S18 acetylase RimI-like enzyme
MPEPLVDIRPFRSGDGDRLRALWTDVGFRLTGDDDLGLARFAERNPGLFLVAVDRHGTIVGSAMGAWDGRRGWLYHVATARSRRRTGLATELVGHVEDALRELGCRRALIVVERGNDGALAFWRAQGYEPRETLHLGKRL